MIVVYVKRITIGQYIVIRFVKLPNIDQNPVSIGLEL